MCRSIETKASFLFFVSRHWNPFNYIQTQVQPNIIYLLTLTMLFIAMQFVSNVTTTLVTAQRVDAVMLAAMVLCLTLVYLFHKYSWEAGFLHGWVGQEFHVHSIATWPTKCWKYVRKMAITTTPKAQMGKWILSMLTSRKVSLSLFAFKLAQLHTCYHHVRTV